MCRRLDLGGGGNVKCSQCAVKPSSTDCCLAPNTRCGLEVITLSPGQAHQCRRNHQPQKKDKYTNLHVKNGVL